MLFSCIFRRPTSILIPRQSQSGVCARQNGPCGKTALSRHTSGGFPGRAAQSMVRTVCCPPFSRTERSAVQATRLHKRNAKRSCRRADFLQRNLLAALLSVRQCAERRNLLSVPRRVLQLVFLVDMRVRNALAFFQVHHRHALRALCRLRGDERCVHEQSSAA